MHHPTVELSVTDVFPVGLKRGRTRYIQALFGRAHYTLIVLSYLRRRISRHRFFRNKKYLIIGVSCFTVAMLLMLVGGSRTEPESPSDHYRAAYQQRIVQDQALKWALAKP